MSFEKPQSKPELPVVTLSEIDASLMNADEMYEMLSRMAMDAGVDQSDALYVGLDADGDDPLERGFGDRTKTWAFTDAQFKRATEADMATGQYGSGSPLYYALTNAYEPLVLVLDGTKFRTILGEERIDDDIMGEGIYSDLEYEVKPGVKFDETVVAVLRIAD